MSHKILTFHKGRSECVELEIEGDIVSIRYENEDNTIEIPAFVLMTTLAKMIQDDGLEDEFIDYIG